MQSQQTRRVILLTLPNSSETESQQEEIYEESKAEYPTKRLSTIKWVTVSQFILGLLCCGLQTATTVINVSYRKAEKLFKNRYELANAGNWFYGLATDIYGTGIWTGVFMLITAIVGIVCWRKNRQLPVSFYKALAALNVFAAFFAFALFGTAITTLVGHICCQFRGSGFHKDSYMYDTTSSQAVNTTSISHVEFYDSILTNDGEHYVFHCTASIFRVWMGLDCLLILSSFIQTCMSLTLAIYNIKVACRNISCMNWICCLIIPRSSFPMVMYQPLQQGSQSTGMNTTEDPLILYPYRPGPPSTNTNDLYG